MRSNPLPSLFWPKNVIPHHYTVFCLMAYECWAVDISVSDLAVISFSLRTAAVWCGWACGSGWRGKCCADRICQARTAGPGNHQKTVLHGCWRPGTHQCLYWWACCPGGYEGNTVSSHHCLWAWNQLDVWGTCCVRLLCHGLLYIAFLFLFFFRHAQGSLCPSCSGCILMLWSAYLMLRMSFWQRKSVHLWVLLVPLSICVSVFVWF